MLLLDLCVQFVLYTCVYYVHFICLFVFYCTFYLSFCLFPSVCLSTHNWCFVINIINKVSSQWEVIKGVACNFKPIIEKKFNLDEEGLEKAMLFCESCGYGGFSVESSYNNNVAVYMFHSQRPVHIADITCHIMNANSILHIAPQLKILNDKPLSNKLSVNNTLELGRLNERPVFCYGHDFGPYGAPHDYNFCINGLVQVYEDFAYF